MGVGQVVAWGKVRAETEDERVDFTARLALAWGKLPHMRLGQLIWNATGGKDIFNTEDEPLIQEIEEYAKRYGRKTNRP